MMVRTEPAKFMTIKNYWANSRPGDLRQRHGAEVWRVVGAGGGRSGVEGGHSDTAVACLCITRLTEVRYVKTCSEMIAKNRAIYSKIIGGRMSNVNF